MIVAQASVRLQAIDLAVAAINKISGLKFEAGTVDVSLSSVRKSVSKGNQRIKQAKAVLVEGMMVIGLTSKARLTSMNILNTCLLECSPGSKGVIGEEDVRATLLEAAKQKVA